MFKLPSPKTFAEGQRQLYGLLTQAAGVYTGFLILGLIALFTVYPWTADSETLRLYILAGISGGMVCAFVAVLIHNMIGGAVGRFKMVASKDGAHLEAAGDGEPGELSPNAIPVTPAPDAPPESPVEGG